MAEEIKEVLDVSFDGGKTWERLDPFTLSAQVRTWNFSPHGSVDHYRSLGRGYRKHSNVLRIAGRMKFDDRADVGQYEYAVSQFYID